MLGLRAKLSLGFGGLLVIILIIGGKSVLLLMELGQSVDVILRENYQSVIAAQDMKEAIERIDSALLYTLLGYREEAKDVVTANQRKFERALQIEKGNITIPGESEKAELLEKLYRQYEGEIQKIGDASEPQEIRSKRYFKEVLPLFDRIKKTADDILLMNQENMSDANQRARDTAATARRRMYVLLLVGTGIAVAFIIFAGKWIVRPITRLRQSADEIARGNLDLVVHKDSNDEIGNLSESFNAMAESLREFRRSGQARLLRIQRSTQQAFRNLPEVIAVLDPGGEVEISTETAASIFGLKPGVSVTEAVQDSLSNTIRECIYTGRAVDTADDQDLIQKFVEGEERYYRPKVVPVLDSDGNVTGAVLILTDVTRQREQDELKRSVIATVSHQLKTPLTSIRMAVHLLLEEKIGTLTERQADLLIAAREDAERLCGILENLLDISRLESAAASGESYPAVPSSELVMDSVDPFRRAAQDKGVSLTVDLPGDLPDVLADTMEIRHVFANLLANALKYTAPGGRITVSAQADDRFVRFAVADTGVGIPAEHLTRIFEQFFRVPGQDRGSGAGLGLSIAKRIVEAHGGKVDVESTEAEGSVFSFSLKRGDTLTQEESDND